MIIKNFEINKINFKTNPFLLFHGKNEGLKNKAINDLLKKRGNITNYEEKEILDNPDIFLENLFNKSLFENEKIIIIKRASDKILKVISAITDKNINDLIIIINANALEKKSKLKSLFEKNKEIICVAFYPDTNETLSRLALNFFNCLARFSILLSSSFFMSDKFIKFLLFEVIYCLIYNIYSFSFRNHFVLGISIYFFTTLGLFDEFNFYSISDYSVR